MQPSDDLKAKSNGCVAAFSDKELKLHRRFLEQYDKGTSKYYSNCPEAMIIDIVRRFLATITVRDKRIFQLEKLTTIDADKRASDRRNIDIIAADHKRIEELEGIAREYGQHKPDCLTTKGTPDGIHADEYCTCDWTSIVCHRIARQALKRSDER